MKENDSFKKFKKNFTRESTKFSIEKIGKQRSWNFPRVEEIG